MKFYKNNINMKNMSNKLFLFVISAYSIFPSTSFAANYFLANNTVFTTPTVNNTDNFFFNILPGRSYCIESLTTTTTNLSFINALSTVDDSLFITATSRGEAASPVYPFFVPNLTPLARRCFITSGNYQNISNFGIQAALSFTSQNIGNGIQIQMNETTLTGGYNTSVTNYNFLELTNILVKTAHDNGVIAGSYMIRNSLSDQIIATKNFSINPQDRIDISIHDIVGPNNYGTISLVHNGPPGSLKGNVSQYRIVSTNPFSIKPVMQQPLLRINGLP